MKDKLTHVSETGSASMVDVGEKDVTKRRARARAVVNMKESTMRAIANNEIEKGEVIAVARVAGIQSAKKCSDLIPLCHTLALSKVEVNFRRVSDTQMEITSDCRVTGQTGVEMEALTAVSVAALTIYDMCKAIDRGMTISDIGLLEKSGGVSGSWISENS